ncbi:MAG: ABC transporter ATP-binding protein [Anaerolineales bacterium]|nr:ABC transporter ATP-binding protein [Anaerolineales bacterium]
MDNSPAIETYGLTKTFGEKTAVSDLHLRVERGEVFGFLGPNGAGKTTAVKMLLGLILPTAGSGALLGLPIGSPESRRRLGFLPEHFRFHEWLTGEEFLRLHAELYSLPRSEREARIPELLELVGLQDHGRKKLSQFSKGMLQRVGLAQSLLSDPSLVFLDEPTSGLDPGGRRLVRDIIRGLREKGATVFLNSHLLSEVEITCDRVAFINHGEVVRVTSLEALSDGEVKVDIKARPLSSAVIEGLSVWGRVLSSDGDRLSMMARREEDLSKINKYLVEAGLEVSTLAPGQISLEEMFIDIVGEEGGL